MTQEKTTPPVSPLQELGFDHTMRKIKLGLGCLTIGLCAIITWSAMAKVNEIAKARGGVEPAGHVQKVESQHGGQLAQLLVAKGDVVKKGQVLAVFDKTEAAAQRNGAMAKRDALRLEVEGLKAFVEGRQLYDSLLENIRQSVVRDEIRALSARMSSLRSKTREIAASVRSKSATLKAIDEELPALDRQIKVSSEALNTLKSLVAKNLAPRPRLIDAVKEHARFERDRAALVGRRKSTIDDIESLKQSASHLEQDAKASSGERLVKAESELSSITEEIKIYDKRLKVSEVISPVGGTVHSIPDTSRGKVIAPGGLIAEIVPNNSAYRFTAKLSPRDIGFVKVGQAVVVKVDAFDFSRFGSLGGKIEEISPTTFTDQRTGPYYEVRVALAKQYLRNDPARYSLRSGMTGELDIITGSKTIFQYLWKPVYANASTAFAER